MAWFVAAVILLYLLLKVVNSVSSLYINIIEHEVLDPRTVEQWDHAPLYCYVCHPEEFDRLRARIILADMINAGSPEAWREKRDRLRSDSVVPVADSPGPRDT